jgi:GAF domain-containing protein
MNQDNQGFQTQFPPDQEFSTNVLIERLVALLRPPVFVGDREKTRKARVLNTLLLSLLVISLLFSIAMLTTSPSPDLPLVLLLILQFGLVSGLVTLRRGNLNGAAVFTTLFIWSFIAVFSLMVGDVSNSLLPGLILVIMIAGMLINARSAILFAVLSVLLTALLTFTSQSELITPVIVVSELNFAVIISSTFLLLAVVAFIANKVTEELNQQLEQREQLLAERSEELEELKNYLTQTVEENTRQLERRNRYLEAAARVAQRSISTFNLQDMLETIVLEISRQLDFYHVGIFLLDERKEWAVLQAASSEGGRQMVARGHRLAVGRQGMVGYVTSIGRPRITQDIELDRIHSGTPELPDTKAEMTLPLKSRDEVIGAIDIQDTTPNAFSNQDLAVLQTMADQIALAVENIRLFEQAQESLEEIENVYGEYSQKGWLETHQKNLLSTFRYRSGIVSEISDEEAQLSGKKVSIPVQVRGFTIGNIELAKEADEKDWTDEELKLLQLLSDQLGIALDSARLFNETQLRASTEHIISEINSQLWETLDINTILKNTATNLRASLDLPELTIRMASPSTEKSSNGTTTSEEESAEN